VEALRRGLALRPAPAGMIRHSDRGIHYACATYRALLKSRNITSSMSRKGNCWDNAVAESFFCTSTAISVGNQRKFIHGGSPVQAAVSTRPGSVDQDYRFVCEPMSR
jgi:hypothetical protein